MKAACCDWAIVNLGRVPLRAVPARTCPKHLRGFTVHVRPNVPRPALGPRQKARRSVRHGGTRSASSAPGAVIQ